ncbi:hypothetical protein FM104_09610 [Microbacterium esteraromaticum]|uniref:Uncharacterized protein n=1 Tax=Microbacterium esteraromaticum TaxID=57043 RepID=A0A1R4JZE5_9MICO|nr:hypothetical protein FM104_09610 [Microbacterium esteraromaticum]
MSDEGSGAGGREMTGTATPGQRETERPRATEPRGETDAITIVRGYD